MCGICENNAELTFTYGYDNQRRKTVLKESGTITNTRYFFGSYEKQITSTGTQEMHYISAGNGLCAIIVRTNGTDAYYYTYTDHLGSILTVTNSTGAVVTEQNFDPWGRYRDANTWAYTANNAPPTGLPIWLYRGYTGHEHLPKFALINMNGRLYDPVLGRMLSPDNYTQGGTQGYNRYSYVLNNPLRYNDPTGQVVDPISMAIYGAVIGAVVNVGVGLITGEIHDWKDAAAYAATGAIVGAIAGSTYGASLVVAGGTGFVAGAVAGGVSGIVSGGGQALANGIYQSLVYHKGTAESIGENALRGAAYGAAFGAIAGGIGEGISAVQGGRPFWLPAKLNYPTATNPPSLARVEFGELTETPVDAEGYWQYGTKLPAPYYPPNDGAMGKWSETILIPGTRIDRFGSSFGKYFSPQYTPMEMRALPPSNSGNYNIYQVLKPLPMQTSKIAPAFGKLGTGTQYLSPFSAEQLVEKGYLMLLR